MNNSKMGRSRKVRHAVSTDLPGLMRFIRENWFADHILGHDGDFFKYRYLGKQSAFNFVVAEDEAGSITGVLGYIPLNEPEPILYLSLWKVTGASESPILGLMLLNFLKQAYSDYSIVTVGIAKPAVKLYEALGYHLRNFSHLVHPREGIQSSKLIRGLNRHLLRRPEMTDIVLKPSPKILDGRLSVVEGIVSKIRINKCGRYLRSRYLEHPFFKYTAIDVFSRGVFVGLIFLRMVSYQGEKACRVIDVIVPDNILIETINSVPLILDAPEYSDAVYVDLCCSLPESYLEQIDMFIDIAQSSELLVPDHFDPVEFAPARIMGATSDPHKRILFKGDGDQDHPRRSAGIAKG